MQTKLGKLLTICLAGAGLAGCGGGDPQDEQARSQAETARVLAAAPSVDAALPPPAAPRGDQYGMSNAIPSRHQWEANYGYCGEVAFVSAGLYYGQYVSQFEARSAATPGVKQSQYSSQLLISNNDLTAARNMHLSAAEWDWRSDTLTTNDFLAWIKGHVLAGDPVIIGVYMNMYLFNGSTGDTSGGSSDYDHIVLVNGIGSNHPLAQGLNQVYYAHDLLQFSDHGLYNDLVGDNSANPPASAYLFRQSFGAFQATRAAADKKSAPPYSEAIHTRSANENAGVAITGVVDLKHETVPVRLTTDINDERPVIKEGATVAPRPVPVTLTATVSGLVRGMNYTLYQYNSLNAIPDSDFNANAAKAYKTISFTATGPMYELPALHILSNEVVAFRAVAMGAP